MHIYKKAKIALSLSVLMGLTGIVNANELHDAVEQNDFQKIEQILKTNPTLMQGFDNEGNTPFHFAIKKENSASLQAFMNYKRTINPQINNALGDTPLVYAIKNKKYDALLKMLDSGFNPFYTDSTGKDSFDYVRIHGDDIIKEIYNDYYARNKNKLEQLKKAGKSNLAPVKDESTSKNNQQIGANNSSINDKQQTVADLLLSNSTSKRMAEVGSAEPESLNEETKNNNSQDEAIKIQELAKKIETLKSERALVGELKEQVKLLAEENKKLKNQLSFKEELGKEHLTEQEKIVANSEYAPIYQQQVMYSENIPENQALTLNDMGATEIIPPNLVDESLLIPEDKLKLNPQDRINLIEQELPIINQNVSEAIINENNENKILLPVDNIPENQAVTTPVENNESITTTNDIKSEGLIDTDVIVTPISEETIVKEEPSLKLDVIKTDKEMFIARMTSDKMIFLVIFCISLGIICFASFIYITLKEKKEKKNNMKTTSSKKSNQKEENITLSTKDKI